MTRYLITVLLFSILLISTANGQNRHRLGVFSALSTEQADSVGFIFNYQWQFHSSFAFESLYTNSGNLKVSTNTSTYQGDQSLLSIGAVFLKQYNPELTLKFSSGANYVLSSSSDFFIQQSSISPYLKLALEYQLTDQLFIEAGQASYFQSDLLGNNHNFFIGINYLFSSSPKNQLTSSPSKKITNPKSVIHIAAEQQKTFTPTLQAQSTKYPSDPLSVQEVKPSWVLQLGAYVDQLNADQALIEFQLNPLLKHYHIEFIQGYFRIISPRFSSHNAAHNVSIELKQNNGISNFIKQLD